MVLAVVSLRLVPRGVLLRRQCGYKRHNLLSYFSSGSNNDDAIDEEVRWDDVEKINQRYGGTVEIRETKVGWGVFATKDFEEGDIVLKGKTRGEVVEKKGSHTIQVDWNKHVYLDLPGHVLNHSCDPSTGVVDNQSSGVYDWVARRRIQPGDEISFDYETTEWDLAAQFPCECGSARCRGALKGFHNNGTVIRQQYGDGFIANYLLEGEVPHPTTTTTK
mmetsp:Transcript_12357/g.20927  ORF Transcript_12357/g.20927 Transcript_12357/m.20927 type:complete len:219 (-) Transcript_12357:33-689(-)